MRLSSVDGIHPAWSPSGEKILCTRYQDAEEVIANHLVVPPIGTVTYGLRRLFVFEWDGSGWVPSGADAEGVAGALVEVLVDAAFDRISVDSSGVALGLFPPRADDDPSGAGCATYVWKFAEWCASERFVVSTVYCTDNAQAGDVALHSRVVLIDTLTSGAADGYTDLISVIEDATGVSRGTYSGAFAACATVPDDPLEAQPPGARSTR